MCCSVSAGMLGEDSWPPAVEFYDFLKLMDMQDFTQKHISEEEEEDEDEEKVAVEEHLVVEETKDPNPENDFIAHSEL